LRIRSIAAVTVIAVLLAAGCGGGGTPSTTTPTPTSQSDGAGNGDTTPNGAPKVKSPLAWESFKAAPCTVITTDQLAAIGVPGVTGKVNPSAPGPACIWQGEVTSSRITPGVGFPEGGEGLDTVYQRKSTYQLFEAQPDVQGYPALLASNADLRTSGDCALVVGITDSQIAAFSVQMGNKAPRYSDPCGLLTEIANQVITNIKAGAK
jgi:hypothetical protein